MKEKDRKKEYTNRKGVRERQINDRQTEKVEEKDRKRKRQREKVREKESKRTDRQKKVRKTENVKDIQKESDIVITYL